jgi:hypothetical protein
MNNVEWEKEKKELKRQQEVRQGLKILIAVGVGAGICGFRFGRKVGYNRGVDQSYKRIVNDIVTVIEKSGYDQESSREG